MLRIDNADLRLTPLGRQIGLADDDRWTAFEARRARLERNREIIARSAVTVDGGRIPAEKALRQPGTDVRALVARGELLLDIQDPLMDFASIETIYRYEGYIRRQDESIERLKRQESRSIPRNSASTAFPGSPGKSSSGSTPSGRRRSVRLAGFLASRRQRWPFLPPTSPANSRGHPERFGGCHFWPMRCDELDLQISEAIRDRLLAYYALLFHWNRKINLTSLSDDSRGRRQASRGAAPCGAVLAPAGSLVDLGSGGGSPAIPLALALRRQLAGDGRIAGTQGGVSSTGRGGTGSAWGRQSVTI